jgi:predicted transcriptional regulator
MITKTQLKDTIDSLPENLTIDQVIDHLVFIEKVQKGLKDSEEGKVYNTSQAKEKLKKWLK